MNSDKSSAETNTVTEDVTGAEEIGGGHNPQTGGFTALFIRRPVFAFVLNVLIVVAGLAALSGVDIRELPDVDRPVISISTTFDGASAETVDREVTQVLENEVARVSGVKNISSTSSFGRSRVTVEFNDGVDINVAAADMRDSISRVANQMPEEADASRIIKADSNADAVMRLAIASETLSVDDMTVIVEDQIVDVLSAVPGVADVETYGDRDKIFRIDIDHKRLASYGLTFADVSSALASMALDQPAGSLRSASQAIVVRATASVSSPQDFENIIIKGQTRIRDVANVTLGPDIESSAVLNNGRNSIGLGIIRQAQSNTLDISDGIRAEVERLNKTLPEGMTMRVTSDDANFIRGAMHEVEIALTAAILIVIAVIYMFLRDIRATLIPTVSIPVALVGTVAAIYLAGFSINILTLLALVLATGLVVDDAIVVLENIVRRRSMGLGPRAAAVLGTKEVFFAVIATTLTLVAVFVPISFLPGQAGGLFREFGFVLAIAVLLSSVVALTLCPMLASRFLTAESIAHETGADKPRGLVYRISAGLAQFYRRSLHWCLNAPWIVVAAALVFAFFSLSAYTTLRQELTPNEDRSAVMLRISGPQGISIDFLRSQLEQIDVALKPLRDNGEIVNSYAIAGSGGASNNGFMVLTLADWAERDRKQQDIVADINKRLRPITGVRAFTLQPNSLGIRGAGNGLQFTLVGNDYATIQPVTRALLAEMEKDPRFQQPRLSVDATQPQLSVQIDRERASDLGIDITGLANAVQSVLDGRRIGAVYIGDRSYDVKMMATSNPINDPTDLENVFMRTGDGRYVSMATIASVREIAVPPQLAREQRLRSIAITSGLSSDFALGDAYKTVQELAAPLLPAGVQMVPLAEAATLGETSTGLFLVFGFAVVIILLVLAAQFESFVSALIVMATVPLGLGCAIVALILTGTSLNVYSQIGLVLLVGIMAKNGILIVEFADQLRDRGLSLREAVEEASNIRLRPVCMTMICAVLGGIPLVIASGAGAEARIALGWIIVGGLGLATIATLYVTPVAYLLLGRFTKPKSDEEKRLAVF
ncbi:efflux RND transporter permease subunit [Pseudochrobactrum sp. AO18b]|uniref:efflux RND transporter permease subunit n=1 Tax=Pseudochrobactrum sp. AO18b TaxID=1201036 RepID=UPI0003A9180B|nr:efflux RND transporter permease subunit [Pseudochrobactrum sp. AO18b]